MRFRGTLTPALTISLCFCDSSLAIRRARASACSSAGSSAPDGSVAMWSAYLMRVLAEAVPSPLFCLFSIGFCDD